MKRFIIIFAFLFLAMPVLAMAEQPPKEVANITQAFIKGGLVIKGEGLPRKDAATPGEKMLTAKRAATVVAQRNMAEVLNGVIVTGQTTVKDMALESDQIRSTVEGMIKGAQIIYDAYDSLTGIAVVYLAIKVDGADGLNASFCRRFCPHFRSRLLRHMRLLPRCLLSRCSRMMRSYWI